MEGGSFVGVEGLIRDLKTGIEGLFLTAFARMKCP